MVSLIEFVWYVTISSSGKVVYRGVPSEDVEDQPMPVDLMAALIQMMTFVSNHSIYHLGFSFGITFSLVEILFSG